VNADSFLAQTLVLSGQAEGAQGLEGGHDNIDVVDDGAVLVNEANYEAAMEVVRSYEKKEDGD
jgi:hypothetical protein